MRPASCQQVSLVPRGLDPLPREKAVNRRFVDAEHPTDANSIQASAVNQSPNRFRVNTELPCHLANAVKGVGPWIRGRHCNSLPLSEQLRYGPTGSFAFSART